MAIAVINSSADTSQRVGALVAMVEIRIGVSAIAQDNPNIAVTRLSVRKFLLIITSVVIALAINSPPIIFIESKKRVATLDGKLLWVISKNVSWYDNISERVK